MNLNFGGDTTPYNHHTQTHGTRNAPKAPCFEWHVFVSQLCTYVSAGYTFDINISTTNINLSRRSKVLITDTMVRFCGTAGNINDQHTSEFLCMVAGLLSTVQLHCKLMLFALRLCRACKQGLKNKF